MSSLRPACSSLHLSSPSPPHTHNLPIRHLESRVTCLQIFFREEGEVVDGVRAGAALVVVGPWVSDGGGRGGVGARAGEGEVAMVLVPGCRGWRGCSESRGLGVCGRCRFCSWRSPPSVPGGEPPDYAMDLPTQPAACGGCWHTPPTTTPPDTGLALTLASPPSTTHHHPTPPPYTTTLPRRCWHWIPAACGANINETSSCD